jgi:hypothetical protein
MRRVIAAFLVLLTVMSSIVAFDAVTFASSGRSLILGHLNGSSHNTTLRRLGPGAALSLASRPGFAPLRVNNRKRIYRLNADTVDGLHARELQVHAHTYVFTPLAQDLPHLDASIPTPSRPGIYQVSLNLHLALNVLDAHVSCVLSNDTYIPNQVLYVDSGAEEPDSFHVAANGTTTFNIRPGTKDIMLHCYPDNPHPDELGMDYESMTSSRVTFVPLSGETVTQLPQFPQD